MILRTIVCMFYHLNELYGMTKWIDKFKIFSITEQQISGIIYIYFLKFYLHYILLTCLSQRCFEQLC